MKTLYLDELEGVQNKPMRTLYLDELPPDLEAQGLGSEYTPEQRAIQSDSDRATMQAADGPIPAPTAEDVARDVTATERTLRMHTPMTALDNIKEMGGLGATRMIPFIGDLPKTIQLYSAAKRFEAGKATESDHELLMKNWENQYRDKDFGYMVSDIVTRLPAYMGEFMATGPAYTTAKGAVTKGLSKVLDKAATATAKAATAKAAAKAALDAVEIATGVDKVAAMEAAQIAKSAARKAAVSARVANAEAGVAEIAGSAVGAAAQTVRMPNRSLESAVKRMTPQVSYEGGKGEVTMPGESWPEATLKGLGDNFVEVWTERFGEGFRRLPGVKRVEKVREAITNKLLPPQAVDGMIREAARRASFQGVIPEVMEEEAGKALSYMMGLTDTYQLTTPKEFGAEVAAFSAPGAAGLGVRAGVRTWAKMNPDKAYQLAQLETPSRKEFEDLTGKKGDSVEGRKAAAQMVREVIAEPEDDTPEALRDAPELEDTFDEVFGMELDKDALIKDWSDVPEESSNASLPIPQNAPESSQSVQLDESVSEPEIVPQEPAQALLGYDNPKLLTRYPREPVDKAGLLKEWSDVPEESVQASLWAQQAPKAPAANTKQPWDITSKEYNSLFPLASDVVDGRIVLSDEIPNQDSISASLNEYTEVKGIRSVPISAFENNGPPQFYSPEELKRTESLAEEIKASGEIVPLIVVYDAEGPYILEGGHRFNALKMLGAKALPAKVVIDEESLYDAVDGAVKSGTPVREDVLAEYSFISRPQAAQPAAAEEVSQPAAQAGPKQPWEMTRDEWDSVLKQRNQDAIVEWNKTRKGFPPSANPNTIAERIRLAEKAGYVLPRDAKAIENKSYHELTVEAARAEGLPVPPEVLAELGMAPSSPQSAESGPQPDLSPTGEPQNVSAFKPSTLATLELAKSQQEMAKRNTSRPSFREWRWIQTGPYSGTIVPNKPGAKFTKEQREILVEWVRSIGRNVSGENANTPTAIKVSHKTGSEVNLRYAAKGEMTAEEKTVAEQQKVEEDATAKREKQQAILNDIKDSPAFAWINKVFGEDAMNLFNKRELVYYLEGKSPEFGGMVNNSWEKGVRETGAITAKGKVDFEAIKKAFELSQAPQAQAPVEAPAATPTFEERMLGVMEKANAPIFIDELAYELKAQIGDTLNAMTMLELKGKVTQLPGKQFEIKRTKVAPEQAAPDTNRIITREHFDAANERISKRRKSKKGDGPALAEALDPENMKDTIIIGLHYFEKGARKFAVWAREMIGHFGESIKPALKDIWMSMASSRELMLETEKKIAAGNKAVDKPRAVRKRMNEFISPMKGKPVAFTPDKLLAFTLQKEEKGSKEGYKEGRRQATAEGRVKTAAAKEDALSQGRAEGRWAGGKMGMEQLSRDIKSMVAMIKDTLPKEEYAMIARAYKLAAQSKTTGEMKKVYEAVYRLSEMAKAKAERAEKRDLIKKLQEIYKKIPKMRTEFGQALKDNAQGIDVLGTARKNIDRLTRALESDTIDKRRAAYLRVKLSTIEAPESVPLTAISTDGLQILLEVASEILNANTTANQMFGERLGEERRGAVESSIKEMKGKNQNYGKRNVRPINIANKAYNLALQTTATIIHKIAGSRKIAPTLNAIFFSDISEGEDVAGTYVRDGDKAMQAAIESLGLSVADIVDWSPALWKAHNGGIRNSAKEMVAGPSFPGYLWLSLPDAGKIEMTKAERAMLLWNMLYERNVAEIIRPDASGIVFTHGERTMRHKFTMEDLKAIWDSATEQEKEIAKAAMKHVNGKLAKDVSAKFEEHHGYPLPLSPNYCPSQRYIKNVPTDTGFFEAEEALLSSLGVLKEAPGGTTPLLIGDIFEVFLSHNANVGAYIGLADSMYNAYNLLYDDAFRESIMKTQVRGEEYLRLLEDQLKDVFASKHKSLSSLEQLARKMTAAVQVGVLALKPNIVAIQPVSLMSLRSIDGVTYKDIKDAIANVAKKGVAVVKQEMADDSGMFYMRFHSTGFAVLDPGHAPQQIYAALGGNPNRHTYGMGMISRADQYAMAVIWELAKIKLGPNATMKQINAEARYYVNYTQPATQKISRSEWGRKIETSYLHFAFSRFQAQLMQNYNIVVRAMADLHHKEITKTEFTQRILGPIVLQSIMVYALRKGYYLGVGALTSVLAGALFGGDDDKKKKKKEIDWGNEAIYFAADQLGNIPGGGKVAGDAFQYLMTQNEFDRPDNQTLVMGRLLDLLDAGVEMEKAINAKGRMKSGPMKGVDATEVHALRAFWHAVDASALFSLPGPGIRTIGKPASEEALRRK